MATIGNGIWAVGQVLRTTTTTTKLTHEPLRPQKPTIRKQDVSSPLHNVCGIFTKWHRHFKETSLIWSLRLLILRLTVHISYRHPMRIRHCSSPARRASSWSRQGPSLIVAFRPEAESRDFFFTKLDPHFDTANGI